MFSERLPRKLEDVDYSKFPKESGLPMTRHDNPKIVIEESRVDSYYPKTKQQPSLHLVVKAENEIKSEKNSESYLGISKQFYPLVSISQREGKITPTKSELGMVSCDPTIGIVTQKQNLSSLHLSKLLFNDSTSRKTSRVVQSCITSIQTPKKLLSSISSSDSNDEISVLSYLSFVKNEGRKRQPLKAKSIDLYLQHCKNDQLSIFKIYYQKDLKLDEDFCQQIHHSVSFRF